MLCHSLPEALSPHTAHIPLLIDDPGNPPNVDCGVGGPLIGFVPGICSGDMLMLIECVLIPGGGIVITGLMSSCMGFMPLIVGDCMGDWGMLCMPPVCAMGGDPRGGECIP